MLVILRRGRTIIIMEETIAAKLKEAGIKTHAKKKKLYTYKDVSLPEISTNKVDLYYKVQKKKHASKIFFIVSKGYDNYISTATDPTIAANIINFLMIRIVNHICLINNLH